MRSTTVSSTSGTSPSESSSARTTIQKLKAAGTALLGAVMSLGIAQSVRAYTPPPSDFFSIGVWLQPTWTMDAWKARGVNTVVGYWPDPAQTTAQWDAAAAAHGFYEIREPQANPVLDVNIKNLLAWSQPDEPDWKQVSPATLAATYAQLKKLDPQRPVYMNVVGTMVLNPWNAGDGTGYKNLFKSADIVSNDIYPVSIWNRPEWIDNSKPLNPSDQYNAIGKRLTAGLAIDTIRPWVGGKEQMAYIEVSWQGPFPTAGPTGPTPSQVRGEVWDAIIHGAKGITYFPQQVTGGNITDATPANVAAEITKQDALITSLGAVINSGNNATDNTVKFSNPMLEGTWRLLNGQKYLFVLNMSSATLTGIPVSTPGLTSSSMSVFGEGRTEILSSGQFTDSFQPYQLHVYSTAGLSLGSGIGSTPIVGGAVPEPTSAALIAAGLGSCLLRRRRRGQN